MEDLLLNEKAEQDRVSLIHKSVTVGQEAACKQTQVTDVKDAEFGAAMQTLTRAPLEKEKFDMAVKSEVGKITSGIIEKCIGDGKRPCLPLSSFLFFDVDDYNFSTEFHTMNHSIIL